MVLHSKMILIINLCKEKLHYFEFVKPIEDILKDEHQDFLTLNPFEINKKKLSKCSKIIICGTSLKDNNFLKNIDQFNWIKTINKPLLGICAGSQIISLIFGSKLMKSEEIGFYHEFFNRDFLGLNKNNEVYHLHNFYCTLPKNFENYGKSKINQAIKHKKLDIYGCLFHPEVRQKDLIKKFIKEIAAK